MNFLSTIFIATTAVTQKVTSVNDYLFEKANDLAGRSWVFDNLTALATQNNLIKAAVIGACFMLVWTEGKEAAELARRRKILLITLMASIMVIGTTKFLSKTIFLPRPFIESQKTFHLEGDQLTETARLDFRVPLDQESQKSFGELQRGEIYQNDLGSFPSDHAGFYMTLAFGILLACRSVGLFAVFWTLFVTLGSRVITGAHSPLDIAVGSGIGIGILLLAQLIFGNFGKRLIDPIVNWTMKHSALSAALIFVLLFEAANTLENVRPLIKLIKEMAKHFIKG